jgi:hypothetical protein
VAGGGRAHPHISLYQFRTESDQEDMKRLEMKVAIITGAASGIGRSAAILFAREQCPKRGWRRNGERVGWSFIF